MTSEINELRESLMNYLFHIQELGSKSFLADSAWDKFPVQAQLLKAQHELLETQVQRYGIRVNASVLARVNEARQLLDEEVAKLEQGVDGACCPIINAICPPVVGILFAERVGLHVSVAQNAYESIIDHLRTQVQLDEVFKEALPGSVIFCKDNRYVRLPQSEKVYSALEAAPGPAVVLLYGAEGLGKSVLASHVGRCYQERESPFTQIVMLECGPDMDVTVKMMDLLQRLGWDSSMSYPGDDFKVVKLLQRILKHKKMLIILDDLWGPELIQSLFKLSGSGVKFLITSRFGQLCDSLDGKDNTSILIEDLKQDDSRKILATHAGFEDQNIPEHLQELVDDIIAQAEANPLTIATLGARIGNAGRNKVEVWESVLDGFSPDVRDKEVLGAHAMQYPKSIWISMKLSLDDLSRKEKELLVLVSMFQRPSMSESVVQFLYSTAISDEICSTLDFSILSNELKSRNLLTEKGAGLFSIHPLRKSFILKELEEDVARVRILLNKADLDVTEEISSFRKRTFVTHALVYLYIDVEFSVKAAGQISHSSDLRDGATIEFKRYISESIMQLLVLEPRKRNGWTEELSMCVDQVLVKFLSDDLLCDKDISELLAAPKAIIPILTFLKNVSLLEASFWDKNCIQPTSSIPSSLLKVLQDGSCPDHQARAASVLADLCWCHEEHSETIASVAGMLLQLTISLAEVSNPDLQRHAAVTLAHLALRTQRGNTTVDDLFRSPELARRLVTSLHETSNERVQSAAAFALANLAVKDSRKGNLATWPGLLDGLAKSLTRVHNPLLQEHAAAAIANIANTTEETVLDKLLNHSGLAAMLVQSLHYDQNPDLQQSSARALRNFSRYCAESTALEKTIGWPGLLEDLMHLLVKSQNSSLQAEIAFILCNIASANSNDTTIGDRILSFPGLVDKLAKALHDTSSGGLQGVAAAALLGNLANSVTRKGTLTGWPGLLEGLTKALIQDDNAHLQENAAVVIAKIATTNEEAVLDSLVSQSGLVDNLVKSLYAEQNSGLQHHSTRAICNIVVWYHLRSNDSFGKLMDWPGLLEGLAKSLLTAQDPSLQEQVARTLGDTALANLASDHTTGNKLFDYPGLLDKLTTSLGEDSHAGLQREAAGMLVNLTKKDTRKEILAGWPGLLEQLANSLTRGDNPVLQEYAAATVANIAQTSEETTLMKLVNQSGLLDKLVKSLCEDQNFGLQEESAYALHHLTNYRPGSTILQKLANCDGLIKGLVEALVKAQNPSLTGIIAGILGNIITYSNLNGNIIGDKLITHPELVDKLVKWVGEDQYPSVQKKVGNTLRSLVTKGSRKDEIVSRPGLLETLAQSLLKARNPSLQKSFIAASIIAKLAWETKKDIARRLVQYPGLVDNLVKWLRKKTRNQDLQVEAARALLNLTDVDDDSIRAKIVNVPRLLETLTASLGERKNAEFEEHVVGILANLAVTTDTSILRKLDESPGLIEGLAKSLAGEQKSLFQVDAARALLNLAGDTDNNLYAISSFPGLLERLTEALLQSENRELRVKVTGALADYAGSQILATVDNAVDNAVDTFGLLDKFMQALTEAEIKSSPHSLANRGQSYGTSRTVEGLTGSYFNGQNDYPDEKENRTITSLALPR